MASRLFGSKRPAIPHLAQPGGGLSGEIYDLRKDIDEAFLAMETEGVFTPTRTVYVDKYSLLTTSDGSFARPFKTIQAALTYVSTLSPLPSDTAPVVISVGPGVYAESLIHKTGSGIILRGAGRDITKIAPATGPCLCITNATLASLATFRLSGSYADLAAEAVPVAGCISFAIEDLTLLTPGDALSAGLELLGVMGDATPTTTLFLTASTGFRARNVRFQVTGAFRSVYARNVGLVYFDLGCIFDSKTIEFTNCYYVKSVWSSMSNLVHTRDAADPLGQNHWASIYNKSSFVQENGSNTYTMTINGADLVLLNIIDSTTSAAKAFQANGASTILFRNCTFKKALDLNGATALVMDNSQIIGNVDCEGTVGLTMTESMINGNLTVAAGAGVVALNDSHVTGTITDASMKITRAGEIVENRKRDGYPRVVGFTGAVAGVKADGSVNLALAGVALLQGQAFAHALVGAFLNLYAVVPGAAGNLESVEVIDSAGGGLAVTYAAHKLTIDLGGATPTEATVATAINALATCHGIIRADSTGTIGAAVVVTAETDLTGGIGAGLRIFEGGQEVFLLHNTGATSVANVTETALTFVPHDLTAHGFVATNAVAIELFSNDKAAMPVSISLLA